MFIWASPNCGNPQKVQRYPRDWAAAFRKMDALGPDILLPGHGLPIVGRERVHQALSEGAELLESLVEQTLALMNDGARLDDIVHAAQAGPDDKGVHAVRAEVFGTRAQEEASTMSKGIFSWAQHESQEKSS